MSLHYVTQQRPITDALRRSVTEDLPELADIGNADLRRKAVEAWAFALSHSSFGRISDLPPGANPGMNVLKRGSHADHAYWSVAGTLGLLIPETLRRDPILRVRQLEGELRQAAE